MWHKAVHFSGASSYHNLYSHPGTILTGPSDDTQTIPTQVGVGLILAEKLYFQQKPQMES
jgi:hypothetical protein